MKNLTRRYSITQFCYWTAISGAGSFATIYLLDKGVSSGVIGFMLALAGLLSCVTQPLLASAADRAKKVLLPQILLTMTLICIACYGLQLYADLPLVVAGVLYTIGIWCGNAMIPLLSALSVAYNQGEYAINYGVARGIGAAATALSSLALGHIIARLGSTWMLLLVISAWGVYMVALAGYPRIPKTAATGNTQKSCSIPRFFARYRWYCASLLGVLFLGMYHVMTENYMIAIMNALGGDSSHVGTALFISAIVAFPVIFCFSKIHSRLRDTVLLKIAALSFLLKAICFSMAGSITTIYLLQLLQITSYAFLEPTQVYYANSKVHPADMVKGQAFITAAYALGGSAGNFTGGQLLNYGVSALLPAGIGIALTGTVILFLTVNKTDI